MKFHLERIAMSLINGISNNIRVFEKLASKQDSDKANTPPLNRPVLTRHFLAY